MGAIAGAFSTVNKEFLSVELLKKMSDSLAHRGKPSEVGLIDDTCMLGHNHWYFSGKESPLKLPAFSQDKNLCLTFSGAIYNYPQLKRELEADGHRLNSDSDAEIVLLLYIKYGYDFLDKLEGMFAFAIYNSRAKKLLLVRDRTGEKPLYYTWYKDTLFFASEMKAFWNIPGFSPLLSKDGVFNYFQFTQCVAPFTVYEGIKKIIPAHYVIFDRTGAEKSVPYWSIDFSKKTRLSFEEAKDKFENVLRQSIQRAMWGSTPCGALLSGGVDSSTIVGVMSKFSNKQIKTFTIGVDSTPDFTDPEFNNAQRIVEKYNTNHRTLNFKTTKFSDFCQAVRLYDEPVGIFDAIQQLYLNKFVKDFSKIVLSGTAADTIIAEPVVLPRAREQNPSIQKELNPEQNIKEQISRILADTVNLLQQEISGEFMSDEMVEYSKTYDSMNYLSSYFEFGEFDDLWGGELFTEFFVYFSHISTFNDNIGMPYGVQVRAPFVDRHLLEYAATLPESYIIKSDNGTRIQKYILKEIAKKYMPEDMVYAPKIMCGQHIDWKRMLKTIWRDDVDELLKLAENELAHFVSYQKVRKYWSAFQSGTLGLMQSYYLLRVVIFFIWFKESRSR